MRRITGGERAGLTALLVLVATALAPGDAQAHGWKKTGTAVAYAPVPVAYAPATAYAPQYAPATAYAPQYAPATAYAPQVAYTALAPQPVQYVQQPAAYAPVQYATAPAPTVGSAPPAGSAPPQLRTYVINGYAAVLSDEQAAKLGLPPTGGTAGSSPSPGVGSAPPAAEPGSVLTSGADLQAVQDAIKAKADELKSSGTTGLGLLSALSPEAERIYAARANRTPADLNLADRKTIDMLTARALGFAGPDASGQTTPQKPTTPAPTQPAATTAPAGTVYLLAPAAYVPLVPVEVRPKHGLLHHKR